MKARVNKIIPFSSVDGPGNRTAIFLQGCNINCLYCHNPETRDKYGDKNITTVTEMSSDEVLEQVKKQIPFVRGITVSGGECIGVPCDTRGFVDRNAAFALVLFCFLCYPCGNG